LIEYDRYTITVNVWINAHGFYDTRYVLQEKLIADLKANGIKLPGM
jgi:small conductance mechanosensitive channel